MEKLRFGIIGCGVIGQLHAQALSSLPDAQLVAVADILEERAQKLGSKYNVATYTDYQQMWTETELDAVCICTPSGLHGTPACDAMRAGLHIVVEKPMEIQLERIQEMLNVQRETGRTMTVISQHRFDAASQRIHQLIEEGAFGRLVLGNAAIPWWRSQAYYDSGEWRGTWALDGGGVLMNQSIHSIDLLQWFMGPVKSLQAYTDTLVHSMETEDVAVAILRFANGALGTITATTGAYPGVTTRIEVFGEKGSGVIEDDRLKFLHLARDEKEAVGAYGQTGLGKITEEEASVTGTADPSNIQSSTHATQIADFISAIRENRSPAIDGQSARHPVEIILGIYESARTKKEVVFS
ncbi:Gfo/Idh/MocA family protein [Ktedonospora formicarum]|uniref:Oxidoreductase n=1 Tax=Ktedonospora formicarum TaxID=2778364 RepID=A0A8J3MN90_9CHLR|nr:Gfo/Idh/MocA family oxidoreductase [Ktedonospora formicarum]GHO42462.1 oxidoreductase [Ktedonospora formicarum]